MYSCKILSLQSAKDLCCLSNTEKQNKNYIQTQKILYLRQLVFVIIRSEHCVLSRSQQSLSSVVNSCCLSWFRVTGVWCAAPPGVKTTPPATCSPVASTGRRLAGTSTFPPCCRRNDLHLLLLPPHSETPPRVCVCVCVCVCVWSFKHSRPAGWEGGVKTFRHTRLSESEVTDF